MHDKQSNLITAYELADQLRVTPETVKIWARQGLIPRVRLTPKVIRFDPSAVLAALARKAEGGAA